MYVCLSCVWLLLVTLTLTVVAQEKTIQSIEGFDKSHLKHADTTVKDPLPPSDGLTKHLLSLL